MTARICCGVTRRSIHGGIGTAMMLRHLFLLPVPIIIIGRLLQTETDSAKSEAKNLKVSDICDLGLLVA